MVLPLAAGCGSSASGTHQSGSSAASSASTVVATSASDTGTDPGAGPGPTGTQPGSAGVTTAARTAEFGPVFKSDVLNIVTSGGYRAVLTVGWHRRQAVPEASVFPGCSAFMNSNSSTGGTGQVMYYAVTAEVSARFPTTSGFSWPSGRTITVRFSDGKETQYWDRAYTCFDSQDLNSSAATLGMLDLSPGSPTATVMWVETAERSPDNPSGSLNTDPGTYDISPDGNCDSAAACDSRYGP